MSLISAPPLETEVRIRQVSASAAREAAGRPAKDDATHRADIHDGYRSASSTPAPSPSLSSSPSPHSSLPSPHPAGSPYLLLLVFLLVLLSLLLVVSRLPKLTSDEWQRLRFPRSQSDVLVLSHTLERYQRDHYWSVVCLFCLTYVFLQAFAIPGPVLLSFLSGPLFGLSFALVVVSLSATAGACCCYWLSFYLARSSVERCFPQLLSSFRQRIDSNRDTLLYTLIALRISPLLPNWFINISAPHLHVPFPTFVLATLIGLVPANYLHVSTGLQVEGLTEGAAGWTDTAWRVGGLCLLAFVALIPTLWAKRAKRLEAERTAAKNE